MSSNSVPRLFATILLFSLGSSVAIAQARTTVPVATDQLPEIVCDMTSCELVSDSARRNRQQFRPAAIADTSPIMAAPPAGQRLAWLGAGSPTCQKITDISPTPTMASPYEYIKGENVPVPLGTTHAFLLSNFRVLLAGGRTDGQPAGSGADVGMLQIRRSGSSTWANVYVEYAFTVAGENQATQAQMRNLYSIATYNGLVDLSTLPGGAGIPSAIDVRMGIFPIYLSGFTPKYNEVCKGQLHISF